MKTFTYYHEKDKLILFFMSSCSVDKLPGTGDRLSVQVQGSQTKHVKALLGKFSKHFWSGYNMYFF